MIVASIPSGVVVKVLAFHRVDLGSIPGGGTRFSKKKIDMI